MNREWRRSSLSGWQNDCVELRGALDAVRDSKNATGPTLRGVDVRQLVRFVRAR